MRRGDCTRRPTVRKRPLRRSFNFSAKINAEATETRRAAEGRLVSGKQIKWAGIPVVLFSCLFVFFVVQKIFSSSIRSSMFISSFKQLRAWPSGRGQSRAEVRSAIQRMSRLAAFLPRLSERQFIESPFCRVVGSTHLWFSVLKVLNFCIPCQTGRPLR